MERRVKRSLNRPSLVALRGDDGHVIETKRFAAMDAVLGATRAHYARAGGEGVARAFAGFGKNKSLFAMSAGQYSMFDIAAFVVERLSPVSQLDLWTYRNGKGENAAIESWLKSGAVAKVRMVVDQSRVSMDGVDWFKRFLAVAGADALRLTYCHAKICTIRAGDWHVVVDGSGNLNRNFRFEQFSLRDDKKIWECVTKVTDQMWAFGGPPDLDNFTGSARMVAQVMGVTRRRVAEVEAGAAMAAGGVSGDDLAGLGDGVA